MKQQNTIIAILLNILFCVTLLWLFSQKVLVRPYLGSTTKGLIVGLQLLATLYFNYFVLYPKLHRINRVLYWLSLAFMALASAVLELAVGYKYIVASNASIIDNVGWFDYFANLLHVVFNRNLALNLIPYVLGDRKALRKSLEREVRIVYQYAKMIDVCDDELNCKLIPIDDIFYCSKKGNETVFYTTDGVKYTRQCTIKYLIQLFGNEDFVRVSLSTIVPYRHIASCDGSVVVMKSRSWAKTPVTFNLDNKKCPQAKDDINKYLCENQEDGKFIEPNTEKGEVKSPRSSPPKNKLDAVFNYIKRNPGCRSPNLISHTRYSKSTIDRCVSNLSGQGLITFIGTKKTGGYYVKECHTVPNSSGRHSSTPKSDSEPYGVGLQDPSGVRDVQISLGHGK